MLESRVHQVSDISVSGCFVDTSIRAAEWMRGTGTKVPLGDFLTSSGSKPPESIASNNRLGLNGKSSSLGDHRRNDIGRQHETSHGR